MRTRSDLFTLPVGADGSSDACLAFGGEALPRPRYAARARCFCEVPMTIINDLEAIAAMIAERTGESPEDIAAQFAPLPHHKKAAINRLATMISSISNDWRLGYVDATPHREDGHDGRRK